MNTEKRHYIDGVALLDEVMKSQLVDQCTEELGIMLMKMCEHILQHSNFRGYPAALKEDMKSFALLKLMKGWPKIKLVGQQNVDKARCFNYCTRTIFNAYLTVLGKHYKQENIKRALQKKLALELEHYSPKTSKKLLDSLLDI